MPLPRSVTLNTPDVQPDYVDLADIPVPRNAPDGESAAPHEPAAPDGVPESSAGSLREHECVPNLPDVAPDVVSVPDAPVESRTSPGGDDREDMAGLAVPRWLRWGYLVATLVLVAVFGLFVFSQSIAALALARTLPEWAQYMLLIPLLFCGAVLLGVCVSLVWSWLRLRSFRQINLAAVDELRRRADSRRDGLEHFQRARQTLERYVADYPLTGSGAARLAGSGMGDATLEALYKDREYLGRQGTDSKSWLDDFGRLFQSRLDETASARVNSWSLKAAGCVMASPLPLLDAILILTISLRMIRELCVVYNVRTGNTASLLLLTRAIRNSFIAGVADDAATAAGDALGDQLSDILGDSAVGTVSSSLARVVAPKLGEGALNALFMRRLGKATIRMLQPLRV